MRTQILDLINSKPRHYSGLILRNPEMKEWVESRSNPEDDWRTRIYAAVHDVDPGCEHGQRRRVLRWGTGLSGCGPASSCACVHNKIRTEVKASKQAITAQQQQEINQRRAATMVERYGVSYNSQRPDIQHVWRRPRVHEQAAELLQDPQWLTENYVTRRRTLTDIGDELGVYYGTVAHWARQHGLKIRQVVNRSQVEDRIAEWLQDQGANVSQGDWDLLGNRELDIVLPDHKVAIEVNGLFWHSWNPAIGTAEDRQRHTVKQQLCTQKGLRLIQITDWHWAHQTQCVQSVLRTALGLNRTIGARQTTAVRIKPAEARKFMDAHHLSGFCAASEHWALVHCDEIVMCASVGRSRFDRSSNHSELVRMATAHGVTVAGGFSKLLRQLDRPLMSYVDLDWFTGSGYAAAGWRYVRCTGPGYFWTDGNVIIDRYRCQRSRLREWLPSFDPDRSESENLFAAGLRRFWNSGNSVWVWEP